jgi:hypothetical protein
MNRTLADGDLSDVVKTLHFECTDSQTVGDVTHTGRVYGTVALEAPDADNFTAYADITEADAIAWAKAAIGAEQVTAHEDAVANQIELSKNPVEGKGVPW